MSFDPMKGLHLHSHTMRQIKGLEAELKKYLLLDGSRKMEGHFHPLLDDTYCSGTGGHSWKAVASYRFTCLREFAIVANGVMNLTGARLYLPLGQPPQHYVGQCCYLPAPTDILYIWDGTAWQPH